MSSRRVTRKWEAFPGRNRFWCDGRLMTAPHPGFLFLTLALICGTCALHFAFDCPFLAERVSPALPACGAALCALTLAALLRTALSDPGIIPRATPHEAARASDDQPDGTARPPPRAKEILVRGRPVKLKYCFTCKMFRPPRASHCSLCDNCVERFDHHCPWVGNCVGRRNYRYFYTFVVALSFLAVYVFACAVAHLALLARVSGGVGGALKAAPASAVVAAVCFLAVWSVLGLAGFHTYLAATDQTTNEDIKGSFSRRRGVENPNPYSRGNPCANCWNVLCGPLAPSLIDRRGVYTIDVRDELPPVLAAVISPSSPPPAVVTPAPVAAARALQPHTPSDESAVLPAGGGGGSYTNLFENSRQLRGYHNHSLEMEPHSLQEVCVTSNGGNVGLSASRLRLLHDTTMIDAALDLDDPIAVSVNPTPLNNVPTPLASAAL